MLKKKQHSCIQLILILSFVFIRSMALAQDPNFTQYYATPMLINPAMTGVFRGDVRVSSTYRNQWPTIQNPFVTGMVSLDASAFKNYLNDKDFAGLGFTGMFDNTNNGGLKSSQLTGSFSYHKALDYEGIHHIGIGFQGAYTNTSVDYSKFVFGSQLTSTGFDPTLPTGEATSGFSSAYFDYSVGLLYSGIAWDNNIYFGGSVFHLNQPKTVFNGNVNSIAPRFTLQAGGDFLTGAENKFYLSSLFMKSGNAQVISLGAVYGYTLMTDYEESSLMLGAFYRYNDAISPYVGFHIGNFSSGLTYDVNISKNKNATLTRGGFEFSLKYVFSNYSTDYKVPSSFLRF